MLLAEIEPHEFVLKVVQVGQMPLPFPSWLRLAREFPEGKDGICQFIFEWQWMPGEEIHRAVVKRSASSGPVIDSLVRQLKETKP
jgi:hypothetical protein